MLKWKALAWNVANQVKDNSARQGSRPRLNESGDGLQRQSGDWRQEEAVSNHQSAGPFHFNDQN